MNNSIQQLVELVRKVDSEFHDSKVHGQGVVVSWNKKKNEWVSGQSAIGRLFGQKNLDYYFVKIDSKPIHIKNIQFEWFEGTSDISLTLEANFRVKIVDQQDVEKFVGSLLRQRAVSIDAAFYQIIDEQLHNCLDVIYSKCTAERKNLLDEFYQLNAQKGESQLLDSEVTSGVNNLLSGMDFKIGFSLRNVPDQVADFNHCTTLKKSPSQKEFNVQSECTLKLNSFQAYKKSGIKNLDDVISQMKSVIDQAINEYVSGKTLFDLFSNFESSVECDTKSISDLVRKRVESEAISIGYALQSFYSLPEVAPLKLLKGIRIDIDEEDGAFSTGYGGGAIKINVGMDVKARHGSSDKLMHLLSPSGDYENIDVLEFTYSELVQRVKKPIISICSSVIKQKDYKLASTDFENTVKDDLENNLVNEMRELYGLEVNIKSIFPVETEDSNRLRELSGRSKQFSFSVISSAANEVELLVEFQSAYKVLGIDLNNGWEAFEKTDFGYRSTSSIRNIFTNVNEKTPDYDKRCKSIAIESEVNDIADEIVRHFKASLELIPSLYSWYRNAADNRRFQYELLEDVTSKIQISRGLIINIETITMDDRFLTEKATEERDRKHKQIAASQNSKNELMNEQLEQSMKRKFSLEERLAKQRESILIDVEDIDELKKYEDQLKDPLEGVAQVPASISQSLTQSQKSIEKPVYDDAIRALMDSKKARLENSDGEE